MASTGFGITARVAAVLVSAAVRARVIAGQHDVSPSEINRATLSWYQLHQLQGKALFDPGLTASRPTLFV
jgi:trans-2-enoyl-CoA reductase